MNENLKLLIIDDFSDDWVLIKESIYNLGYELDYFEDPYNAIENFAPGKYSLVFLGINVKGLDGFDLYDDINNGDVWFKSRQACTRSDTLIELLLNRSNVQYSIFKNTIHPF